mgnify:CR=1 FL=1
MPPRPRAEPAPPAIASSAGSPAAALSISRAITRAVDMSDADLREIEMRAIPHWQTFLEGTDRLTLAT